VAAIKLDINLLMKEAELTQERRTLWHESLAKLNSCAEQSAMIGKNNYTSSDMNQSSCSRWARYHIPLQTL